MANLRRIPYTKPIPADAAIITHKGKPHARFKDRDGKTKLAPLTKDGKRIRVLSKKWYGEYRDANDTFQCVPLSTDKTAAQQMLNELVKRAELEKVGIIDPFEANRKRALAEHLEDFRRFQEAKGNSLKHVVQTCSRIEAILDGCKVVFMADLSPSALVEWLADERKADRMGIQTSNYYLRDFKSFCSWLVKDGRMDRNPLAHLSGMNADLEDGLERRALPADEFTRLIEAARQGKAIRRLPGRDRAMLYTIAAFTGFRESELASLTPESFTLDADPPGVTVQAGYSKRRRKDTQPLRPDLAALIREWLAAKPAGKLLWPGSWKYHGAKLVRADLQAARQTWIEEAKDNADERRRREESLCLCYQDGDGRVFDFHALRHQFISSLAAAGVHPKVAQILARHSTITLTMDRYTHLGLFDQTAALEKLPQLPMGKNGAKAEPLAATGTDNKSPTRSVSGLRPACGTGDIPCDSVTTPETAEGVGSAKNGKPQILKLKRDDSDCDPLIGVERKEAPPGFEPGMADLQSAALPLG